MSILRFISTMLLLSCFIVPSHALNGDQSYARFHPVSAKQAMVSSQDALATQVGIDILQKGGNAIDAAVATAFTLSVTHQAYGGLGGGGFMLIHLAKEQKTIALNYREIAPLTAKSDMFLNAQHDVDRNKIGFSHLASGVPGTVAGLLYAQQTYGSLPLETVMQPAIQWAERGFPISQRFASILLERKQQIENWPASAAIFMPQGQLLAAGDALIQKDLAHSLRLIAKQGAAAFYQGEIAKNIVADMQATGGIIGMDDLAQYKVQILTPLRTTYHDYQIITMPLPSAGGIALIQILNMLKDYPLAQWGLNSSKTIHVMTEAINLAFLDRHLYLGDADFVAVPVDDLLNAKHIEKQKQQISLNKHRSATQLTSTLTTVKESPQTSHFVVVDKDRNMVSNTFTLNYLLGSGLIVSNTGILLNNEMDDFDAKVNAPNAYGLLGSSANKIQPRKYPLSSMTPTIVLDAKNNPVMVTGGIGGSRIVTIVLQVLLNVLDHQLDIATATNSPRFHTQWQPDEIDLEQGFSQDTIDNLVQQGHQIKVKTGPGAVQSILIVDDTLYGAADPRIETGKATGY